MKRPPVRFLHDVIMKVRKETGYLIDIFTEAELHYKNLNEKSEKTVFFEKLIREVVKTLGDTAGTKLLPRLATPDQILAGQNSEGVNTLLQALAMAAATHQAGALLGKTKSEEKPAAEDAGGTQGGDVVSPAKMTTTAAAQATPMDSWVSLYYLETSRDGSVWAKYRGACDAALDPTDAHDHEELLHKLRHNPTTLHPTPYTLKHYKP